MSSLFKCVLICILTSFLPIERQVRQRVQISELSVEPFLTSGFVVDPDFTQLSRWTGEVNRHGRHLAKIDTSHVTTRVLAPFEIRMFFVDEHAQFGQELYRGEFDLVTSRVECFNRVVDCKMDVVVKVGGRYYSHVMAMRNTSVWIMIFTMPTFTFKRLFKNATRNLRKQTQTQQFY